MELRDIVASSLAPSSVAPEQASKGERGLIAVRSATKIMGRGRHRYYVLKDVTATFSAKHKYVVLGARGSGKSTLLRLLTGMQKLGRGHIEQRCKVLPPMGTAHVYAEYSTPRGLCKTFCQLYGADTHEVVEFTKAFSGLGKHFDIPVRDLAPEMRSRMSFALGYAVPADIYVFDGLIGHGTPEFREQCKAIYAERCASAGTIFATRDLKAAPSHGDRGVIIHDAKLYFFNSVEEAVYAFHRLELEPKYGTLDYAEELLSRGLVEEARTYIEESDLIQTDDAAAHEMLANVSMKLGDSASAKQAAIKALATGEDRPDLRLLLAKIAAQERDNPGVVEHAEAYLARHPDHRETRLLLARAYEAVGAHGPAGTVWRTLLDDGRNQQALRLAIRCELRAELWDGALELIDTALAGGDDLFLLEFKARALQGLGRWTEFKAVVERIKKLDHERAMSTLYKAMSDVDAETAIDLGDALTIEDLSVGTASRSLAHIAAYFERSARIAKANEMEETAERLLALAARIRA